MENQKTVSQILHEKGVKRKWLSEKMGVNLSTISRKLHNDNFTKSERYYIQALLNCDLGIKI